jgi:hypothetical protein
VLTTIDLDDDELFPANKVTNISADGFLPNELVTIDLPIGMRFQSFVSASVWLLCKLRDLRVL